MANSRKSRAGELSAELEAVIATHVPTGSRLTIGLSGGMDSIVLLDALAPLAAARCLRLDCLHVHHGISPNADRWAAFATAQAARYGLPCVVRRVDIHAHPGLGLEAAAREARYEAFAACDSDFVVCAHHQDDQAETLLLQLVRGAGVNGLAAMPVVRPLSVAGPQLLRPLLGVSRADIEAYARASKLEWVDDESNADATLARNRLRHHVLPQLRYLNPAAVANIARSAAHLGEAAGLLEQLAELDLQKVAREESLDIAALTELEDARARNLLRHWLQRHGLGPPSTIALAEMLRQLHTAGSDAAVRFALDGRSLRRFRGRAYLVRERPIPPSDYVAEWDGEPAWSLPELGGTLHFEPVVGAGIAESALRAGPVCVRLRQGGESFQPDAKRPRRRLKSLLQEQGIPPWERSRMPLLYCADVLAWVPGIGVAAALQAGAGEAGCRIRWDAAP